MRNRHVGYLIMGMTLVFLLLIISFNMALESIVTATCTHGTSCTMHTTLTTQKAISYSLVALLFIVGLVISFFLKDEQKQIIVHQKKQEQPKIDVSALDEEEQQVISLLQENEGSIYQSDLIKQTGLTKVKMTRLLDRLEGKQLLERKRRGMTNIVLLKE